MTYTKTSASDHVNERPATPDIWLFDISNFPSDVTLDWWRVHCGLVADELSTANRYRHSESRMHYLGGRALARHALATVVGCSPDLLRFGTTSKGKPRVLGPSPATDWHFNLSHSGKLIACGVWDRPLGIDVEPKLRQINHALLTDMLLCCDEVNWIFSKGALSKKRFMALWTLKEAYLKESGVGLSISLNQITVRPESTHKFIIESNVISSAQRRHGHLLCPRSGFWLAICTASVLLQPRLFDYMPIDLHG